LSCSLRAEWEGELVTDNIPNATISDFVRFIVVAFSEI
jgi:hypothetical protein